MEPFKNIYNKSSVKMFAREIKLSQKNFPEGDFFSVATRNLNKLEMKDRVRQISRALKESLPEDYPKAVQILVESLAEPDKEKSNDESGDTTGEIVSGQGLRGFMVWPLTQFVEEYGLEHFEESMEALYEMTQRFTAEFAIRPFIQNDPQKVFRYLNTWLKDPSRHVRRLCSEGIRPNLPWGLKVAALNENLKRNIRVLEKLKDDPEEYVRRSVANHLNDISRLDEDLMLTTCEKWNKGKVSKERQWLIRHASRSLLKAGHPRVLKLHGYTTKPSLEVQNFAADKKKLKEGDTLNIELNLKSKARTSQKLIIDYIIHYIKKNGQSSPKVFRWKDFDFGAKEEVLLQKKVSFKAVTTRQQYSGEHKIELQINGEIFKALNVHLKV